MGKKICPVTLMMTGICIVIGFMIAIQFQTNQDYQYTDTRDMNEIRVSLQRERERSEFLLQEISKHDQLLYEYEMSMNREDRITDIMEQELERLRKIGGFEDIVEEGFVIRITSVEGEKWQDMHSLLIYDEDLRFVVNELNAYGAKAIAINNQRLMSTSAIRNVGDKILVNTVPIQPPYEIKVIGEHSILIPALKLAGIEQYFMVANYEVSFEVEDEIRVPGFRQRVQLHHMEPVKEESE
ncbi:DUF881 domain-containing protein [Caldalkalibacillus salinus]|uniref:DUF881 domain-containing protein n=1 Tax=Caldalkalibacillus salinus TaxID=2803787 RepID=UPI001921D1CD|nr:DUF881 domain-containing protein [Caldalkalibacillus salinus]